jgi:hypothetical protein
MNESSFIIAIIRHGHIVIFVSTSVSSVPSRVAKEDGPKKCGDRAMSHENLIFYDELTD